MRTQFDLAASFAELQEVKDNAYRCEGGPLLFWHMHSVGFCCTFHAIVAWEALKREQATVERAKTVELNTDKVKQVYRSKEAMDQALDFACLLVKLAEQEPGPLQRLAEQQLTDLVGELRLSLEAANKPTYHTFIDE